MQEARYFWKNPQNPSRRNSFFIQVGPQMEVPVWILICVGVGLLMGGLIGLGLGIWIGQRWTKSHWRPSFWPTAQAQQLAQLAQAMSGLIQSVTQDVDQHQSHIQHANEGLRSLSPTDPSAWAAVVLRTVAEIVQVNERLLQRLQSAEEKLHQQAEEIQNHMAEARTDPLTGLPNRRAFHDDLVRRLAEWQRKGTIFCLLVVDVDHFKSVNDVYGHPVGDHILRQLAKVFQTVFREMDLIARIGGEEFAMVLPSTNLCDAMRVAQRVRAAVADTRFETTPGQTQKITISLGLAPICTGDHLTMLLSRADQALYAAKQMDRDCGYYHDGEKCRPIPFCSPPDRGVPTESFGMSMPSKEFPGELQEEGQSTAALPEREGADSADFQIACEALRNQLESFTRPSQTKP